ncbi:hypothetical protein [Nocardia xishanensis]|uniref:hypothetical protein n=1 Tax=Nocardia xishanensis TaxID=238964 RepID=UPI0008368C76|nr:hypothetical protein [Nocardia xishanensis]
MGDKNQEPQSARGEPGSRDTGSEAVAGGPSDREPGDIGHEELTSADEVRTDREKGFTTEAPTDTEAAVPPYEGRKETANPPGETATGEVGGADVGGATTPTPTEDQG